MVKHWNRFITKEVNAPFLEVFKGLSATWSSGRSPCPNLPLDNLWAPFDYKSFYNKLWFRMELHPKEGILKKVMETAR